MDAHRRGPCAPAARAKALSGLRGGGGVRHNGPQRVPEALPLLGGERGEQLRLGAFAGLGGASDGLLPGVGECARGESCDALACKDDYLAYRGAHMRVTSEWLERPARD